MITGCSAHTCKWRPTNTERLFHSCEHTDTLSFFLLHVAWLRCLTRRAPNRSPICARFRAGHTKDGSETVEVSIAGCLCTQSQSQEFVGVTVAFSCRFRFYFTRAMPTPEEHFRLLVQAGASYIVCA